MSDKRSRSLERRWHNEGTWGSWRAWVRALARTGDPRGEALEAVVRAARGYLVYSERHVRIVRPTRPLEPGLYELANRARSERDRFMRAFCRAMNWCDRLECLAGVDSGNWIELLEYEQDYNARALFEAMAHTIWSYYEGGRRRRTFERNVRGR